MTFKLTDFGRAADELEHILDAALARLDARERQPANEETTMGHCYGEAA